MPLKEREDMYRWRLNSPVPETRQTAVNFMDLAERRIAGLPMFTPWQETSTPRSPAFAEPLAAAPRWLSHEGFCSQWVAEEGSKRAFLITRTPAPEAAAVSWRWSRSLAVSADVGPRPFRRRANSLAKACLRHATGGAGCGRGNEGGAVGSPPRAERCHLADSAGMELG